MVPALTTGGRSFKGAALYYLHDKRREGEAERLTSDRVAWTHAINLPTDDPDRAWRMMATTALKADELKAAAGVKSTGRKLTKPVSAYSLSWHPSERPTQAEQLEAAKETLKLLGLGEHQALIICHNDAPHAHVHIVANRVHPAEGKAASLSNSKLILSEWALGYEQKRGKILCEEREKNQAKRKKQEYTRASREPRPTHDFNQVVSGPRIKGVMVRQEQARRDAQLAASGRAMHENHTKQWEELKAGYRAEKDALYSRAADARKQREEQLQARYKPHWAAAFQKQRDDRRTFQNAEKTAFGMLRNIVLISCDLKNPPRGVMSLLWNIVSSSERMKTFDAAQAQERKALSDRVSAVRKQERERISKEAREKAEQLRKGFLGRCTDLRAEQQRNQQELRRAWQQRNEERKAAYEPLRDRSSKWKTLEEGRARGRGDDLSRGEGLQRRRDLRPG